MTLPLPLQPMHALWQLLPVDARRRLFARVTASLAPRPDRLPPKAEGGLAVAGEVTQASGLGEAARLIQRAVLSLGLPSPMIDFGAAAPGAGPDPALAAEVASGLVRIPPRAMPLIVHANPTTLPWSLLRQNRRLVRGRLIVGYWLWELEAVPPEWAAGLDFVHEVWTSSRFGADAIAALPGIARRGIPVRVVGLPVAISPPRPAAIDRAAFGLSDKAIMVLVSCNVSSSFARKNPLGAVAAFREAFGDRSDRLLVLKLLNADRHPGDLAQIRAAIAGAANIRVETRHMPPAEAHALTACADIVLSLHRSEGFGLVPAEAMLLGRAVVATAWSGNLDFMDESCAALIPVRLVPVVDPRRVYSLKGARWAEPDHGAAVDALRRLADDVGARHALGARARAAALTRLGAGPLAQALLAIGVTVPGSRTDAAA